jgi:hypothetical protein
MSRKPRIGHAFEWASRARFRDIAELSSDYALTILAEELDLRTDDAETLDFMRQAFQRAVNRMQLNEAEDRAGRLRKELDLGDNRG